MKDCILLVDDNLAVLKQTSALLAGDYRTVMAKSGAQAVAMAEKVAPTLILLDVEMPEMDGFQTIARLKENPRLAQVPVIFLTGNHDTETQIRALKSGGVDFIKKPFEKRVLLHRIRLHTQLSRYQVNLERTVRDLEDGIISSFAEIAECRDVLSGGHVYRTRRYMELFTRLLTEAGLFADELDAQFVDIVVRASVLHDIGKIGISDTILLKPGRLTEEEYAVAKTHADIGARELLRINDHTPMSVLLMGATIAQGYHERYDGSGYPRGLRGDDIPLCCRLMSVVNVYDALVSPTVYRPAMDHATACGIIRDGAGTEFDPRLVDVFLEHHDGFDAVARELTGDENGKVRT